MAANLADLSPGINRERYTRKLAAWRGNSADFLHFCGKIPLFGRFNSAVPQRSGIDAQAIDLT
jgi:hypothetical protein